MSVVSRPKSDDPMASATTAAIADRVAAREAVVGVAGLGYVGLPVAVTFAEAGFRVVGVDRDRERLA
ncbi:MAG: UDP-N-acetyl-D-glucosamine dehydrogenase, partial [Actinomycetota bacterium]